MKFQCECHEFGECGGDGLLWPDGTVMCAYCHSGHKEAEVDSEA